MNRQLQSPGKRLSCACILFLALSLSLAATAATTAATSPKPGAYCPGTDIRLVAAEELSASLDLVMESRESLTHGDRTTAMSELASAGTALRLAASRGAAARTRVLIDAVIQAKAGEDYTQMLAWFPLLHTSLLTLPNDAAVSVADESLGRAEEIMQGDKQGDPVALLKEARHRLACDALDIPLQEAMQAQGELLKQLGQRNEVKSSAHDVLVAALRRALLYALEKQ